MLGLKNFLSCILLARQKKHALSEFQLFTATWRSAPSNHYDGSECVSHLTLTITSGLRDPNSLPLQNRKEWRWPQAHILTCHTKMKLLKRGKRFDACSRRYHVVTTFD